MRKALLATIVIALSLPAPRAQERLAFETASVKVNTSGGPRVPIRMPAGGLFNAVNVPLSDLILFAYGVLGLDFRATGIPAWASTTNYDVSARMDVRRLHPDGSFSIDDMRAMVRTLLQERFKLVSRMEQRDAPIYALVKARADETLGAHLQKSGAVCPPIVLPAGMPIPPPPPPPPGDAPRDGAVPFDFNCAGMAVAGHIFARRTTMGRFAEMLSIFVRRVVVDRTGLDGTYDADLDYFPDPAIAQQGVFRQQPGASPPPGIDANAPELFTAIQEQLGLKLQSTRAPIEMVVVDSVDRLIDD